MRRFANFYIVLFLIDAGLSLTDELLSVLDSPLPALSALRDPVAFGVIALSLVVFTLLGVDRRLSKRIFLPLTLYAFWCSMALWPLAGLIPREFQGLMAAFGQVVLGGVAVIALRSRYGGLQLPEELFRRPMFGWRNTLLFAGVNLLLLPLVLTYSLLAICGTYLDQATAGFMRVSPVGIYSSERSYHNDGRVVRLVAMMHMARPGYYKELVDSLPAARTIVLAEGVSDRDRLMKNRFNYGPLASLVGLTSQETMSLDGNPVALEDLAGPDGLERDETRPDIVRADLDINRFDPMTVELLNALGRTLLADKPLGQGLVEYNAWLQDNATPQIYADVMADILDKRNEVVIGTLQRSLERYDTVVVPWGAMHMPALEKAVLERGFVPGDEKERLVFAFSDIPYATLWQTASAGAERVEAVGTAEGTGVTD